MIRVSVIAGTPVDTQMGVDYIQSMAGNFSDIALEPLYRPVSASCDDQIRFQYSDDEAKRRRIDEIFDADIEEGVQDFFIYCNSLSGAFDFDTYAAEKSAQSGRTIHIYTPLQIYRDIGSRYGRVGVVAANNLSAYNIEKNLMSSNDELYMIGTGNMAIVSAIEAGLEPSEIITSCGVDHLIRYMDACSCEALLLGCTHFPYLRGELEKICSLKVIDPAEEMLGRLIANHSAE